MSEQYGFKTSFRGFSRQDVLNYIDGLRMTLHTEREEHQAAINALQERVNEAERVLEDAPQAQRREEELRAELAESQDTVTALRQQVERLAEELQAAQAELQSNSREEAEAALAEARAEVQQLRERETLLNGQLAETHQAVAALWQEKDASERKVAVALAFADAQQQAVTEFKQQVSGAMPAAEEATTGKPMERWLF